MKKPELGKFFKEFGQINEVIDFAYQMQYEESGLCCFLVMIHLLKRSNINEIKINN